MKHVCPYCEVAELAEVRYSRSVKAGRKAVEVDGLTKLVCSECGEESVPLELYEKNAALIEGAIGASRGAVSRGMLRRLRETWGVSQRDASRLFGAGTSAFGKWESGQAQLSTPSALLVQCAIHIHGVMPYLASLASVQLDPHEPCEQDTGREPEPAPDAPTEGGFRLVVIHGGAGYRAPSSRLPPSNRNDWDKSYSIQDKMRVAA
jgi:putative zinc finger/helix-turn-helix YgiT family protein